MRNKFSKKPFSSNSKQNLHIKHTLNIKQKLGLLTKDLHHIRHYK